MKVLILNTSEPSLRSEVWGWGYEDSSLYVPNKPIGFTPSLRSGLKKQELAEYSPKTVLEALANGWKLLGTPQSESITVGDDKEEAWTWWLTKE